MIVRIAAVVTAVAGTVRSGGEVQQVTDRERNPDSPHSA